MQSTANVQGPLASARMEYTVVWYDGLKRESHVSYVRPCSYGHKMMPTDKRAFVAMVLLRHHELTGVLIPPVHIDVLFVTVGRITGVSLS